MWEKTEIYSNSVFIWHQILMSVLWNSVRVIQMLIVSTLMALIAALVNKDILEMEESVKVIILEVINEIVRHQLGCLPFTKTIRLEISG